MKKLWKRGLAALCAMVLLLGLLPMGALAAEEHTLWIVGDSTVCDFGTTDAALYYPRYGYGTQVGNYLDGTYKVENLALSGRSSKSFVTDFDEKNPTKCGKVYYERMLAEMKPGDALVVGFGHNDEKVEDTERYTSGNGDWQTEGSFAKSLYDNYVKPAQDRGAEVILCTPIVRRTTKDAFSNSEVHVTAQGDYPAAIRELGTDKNVAVVDLTALTKALYEELTPAGTGDLHSQSLSPKDGEARGMDNTHLNIYGAKVVARMLASALAEGDTELGKHVVLGSEPDKATDLVSNPNYVEPSYVAPAEDAQGHYPNYTTGDATFKGTFFGEPSGNTLDFNNYVLETDGDGNVHMAARNDKSKIEGGKDGVAMYYVRVPMGKQVELSAKMKLNSFSTHNQTAFGLMARDDMYIDEVNRALASDYVAAGTFGSGNSNCFYRRGGTLNKTSALSKALAVGDTYALSIKSNSDGYTCQFGDEPAQSGGFDFQLNTVDPDYYYVGMFVSRNADVTFSDIYLEVDGTVLCGTQGGDTPDDPTKPDDPKPDEPVVVDGAVAGGGLETIFAQIADVTDADVTAVKYTGTTTGQLTGADLEYLVRDVDGGVRIDIPGVKAGTYTLKVTVKGEDYTAKNIEVKAHDRSGFAHQTVDANSVCTPYTEGVGAYKDDGTLKDNALVLYVTEENKETISVTASNGTVITGIGNILNAQGPYKSAKYLLNLQQPLVIRIIGDVTKPVGTTDAWASGNGGAKDDAGGMCVMSYVGNVTIEGIGPDATVDGWGFCLDAGGTGRNAAGNKRAGHGENCEVRNLTFRNVPEDCIGIKGEQKSKDDGVAYIDSSAEHIWVHNNSFYGPKGLPDQSKDGDKSEGDGAVDFRQGEYMTLSYNYFDDYHKTSLIGSDDDNLQYHVTWHHNWWKNVNSRSPLARQADVHIYNNRYEGQTFYCMSLRANTYIFSEYNTFVNCKNPVVDEGTGGVCKSYQDLFEGCTEKNNANIVTDKTQTVTSANQFANFDTHPGSYVAKGAYLLDTADRGQANIAAWNGALKTADKMDTVPMTVGGEDDTVAVTGVSLNKTTASVKVGKTLTLTATVAPTDATDPSVTWTTSDAEVATVDETGKVTAVAVGSATITVTTTDGGKSAACVVTVTAAGGGTGTSRPSSSTVPEPDTTEPGATEPGTTEPGTTTPAAPVAETYGDVEADSWYTSGVQFVVDKKLFIGVSDRAFAPSMSMSRAMVMTVLARVDGKEPVSKAGEPWYAEAMAWAVTAGVSDGTNPNGDVTLEQFATMLYRYAVDKKLATAVEADLSDVPDGEAVSDWAAQAITWAKAQGILQGDQAGKLNPQNNASRAQAAVILERFVEKCVK